MKDLNVSDVEKAAQELIEKNGTTTSLDIKNLLRSRGFFALQSAVSAMMDNLCFDHELFAWEFNGQYRTYSDQVDDDDDDDDDLIDLNNWLFDTGVNTPVLPTKFVDPPQPKHAVVTYLDVDEVSSGDWIASQYCDDSKSHVFIKGDVTRNQARYSAAKTLGIPYEECACSRVKD